jgi:hypothetical protein
MMAPSAQAGGAIGRIPVAQSGDLSSGAPRALPMAAGFNGGSKGGRKRRIRTAPPFSGCADAPPERGRAPSSALAGCRPIPNPCPFGRRRGWTRLSRRAGGKAPCCRNGGEPRYLDAERGGAVGPSEKTPKNRAISMQSERPIYPVSDPCPVSDLPTYLL